MADFEYVDVNGRQIRVRPRETAQEIDEYGNFHRQPNRFTEGFGEGKNPVEKDRYILFWAKGCNWSNRAAIARELLGLEDAVKVEIVDWTDREENLGWEFVNSPDHINPETGAQFLSELYYNADEEYTGRTTVPAFVDYKTKKVVNNDYHWLTNHLETAFRPFHKKGAPDLYPEELRPEIDKLNKWLFENVNNAVYRAQFAESLQAFADGYETFFAGLDAMEERLADKRFLFGDYVTDSDIRLYTTIARLDPVLGIHYISEAYLAANPDYTGRFTVPALVDIPSGKVVNNDYFNLTLYFETAWKPYHKEGAPDLYPEDLREEIDKLNDIIFREVNNGVYKAGFARKQKAYDRAYNMVFNRLDWLEERLANQRYLFGDRLTESDVRLYVTLVRFDCAYYPVFRLNKKLLRDYPNLWAYARDLYQTPGFGDTTNFAAIKKHYHIDCCPSNEFAIVPNGPDETLWMTPHGREKLSGK